MNDAQEHSEAQISKISGGIKGPRLQVHHQETVLVQNPENKKTCRVAKKDLEKYTTRKWKVVTEKEPEEEKEIGAAEINQMNTKQLAAFIDAVDSTEDLDIREMSLKDARVKVIEALELE